MDKFVWIVGGGTAYVVLFMATVLVIGLWRRRQRRERAPVEFKLLRAPGESLRRNVQQMDEEFVFHLLRAASIPLVAAGVALWGLSRVVPHASLTFGLSICAGVLLVCAIATGCWLWSKVAERRNYLLGYLGERTVGEALLPLVALKYHAFHDVPAEASGRKFNLDHVVVGPTGVFLIETKTRRKGRARPGFKDHEVGYDGQKLIWPWAEDRHGLEQAEAEARWLADWLNKLTGFGISVRPILALPGWYVKATAVGTVTVVNAKGLTSAIKGRGVVVLSDAQVDLLARQLDQRCRDVVD